METIKNIIKFTSPGNQEKWEEFCLPIGNGYLGATFFGGIEKERIALNEKTLWTGGPSEYRPDYNGGNRKNAYKYVKEVQQLLHDNKYNDAIERLPMLTCENGDGYGSYQLLCDAVVTFSNINPENVSNYYRQLDLDNSIYECAFDYEGAHHIRKAFASYPNRVVCMNFSSDKPRRICIRIALDKCHDGSVINAHDNQLDYFGSLSDNQLRYQGSFFISNNGGEIICSKDSIMVFRLNLL